MKKQEHPIKTMLQERLFTTVRSKYSFYTTIEKIRRQIEEHNLCDPVVVDFFSKERELGIPDASRVITVSIHVHQLDHRILGMDKKYSAFLPVRLVIHEEGDAVYLSWLNFTLVGEILDHQVLELFEKITEIVQNIVGDLSMKREKGPP